MRKSRIAVGKQEKLIEYFLLGSTARMAAELAEVNRNTATYCFQRLRELIFQYQEEYTIFFREIEVDENYFGEESGRVREDVERLEGRLYLGC